MILFFGRYSVPLLCTSDFSLLPGPRGSRRRRIYSQGKWQNNANTKGRSDCVKPSMPAIFTCLVLLITYPTPPLHILRSQYTRSSLITHLCLHHTLHTFIFHDMPFTLFTHKLHELHTWHYTETTCKMLLCFHDGHNYSLKCANHFIRQTVAIRDILLVHLQWYYINRQEGMAGTDPDSSGQEHQSLSINQPFRSYNSEVTLHQM